jgi:multidrug efflux pump subunit AcrA (membrane-fusion protein)
MKKTVISIIIIAALAVGGVTVVKRKQKEIANLPKPGTQIAAIQTATAHKGSLEILSHQIGDIEPYTSADIAPRITGHILSISKREGDRAEKGEVVAVIDNRELNDRVRAIH